MATALKLIYFLAYENMHVHSIKTASYYIKLFIFTPGRSATLDSVQALLKLWWCKNFPKQLLTLQSMAPVFCNKKKSSFWNLCIRDSQMYVNFHSLFLISYTFHIKYCVTYTFNNIVV